MLSAVIASSSIVVTSLLLGAGLLVAWREFGLQRHVALWALSFMAAATGHGLRIAGSILPQQQELFTLLACHASVASFALLAWGFRLRVRCDARLVLACWLIATVVLLWVGLSHGVDWRTLSRIATAAADATMVAIIVTTLRSVRGAGRIAHWALVLCGLYIASMGVAAWLARPGGTISDKAFIDVLSIGTPTGMIGGGILTLLIVAIDLARELRDQASTDALTGLLNRRGIDEAAEPLLIAAATNKPLAVVVADLDHFKAINDRLGHAAGDDVLRQFAAHLRTALRPRDIAGRLGGEEFILLLPDTVPTEAMRVVETIRTTMPALFADTPELGHVGASFGIAVAHAGQTLPQLVARADAALYRSKRDGRDRVTLDPHPALPA